MQITKLIIKVGIEKFWLLSWAAGK